MTNSRQGFALLSMIILFGWGVFSSCQSMAGMETRPSAIEQHPNTIAVWDLQNLNPAELEGFNLGELLAAKVMESFETSGQWVVVEREELILALEEQQLGSTEAVSEETRLRIGKILGAQSMLFGSYMKFMQTLQLNLRIVDVQSGRILQAIEKTAPFQNIGAALEMATQAAIELQK